ncbi:MAG: LLM class flavin-dependent oxidoreductase [Acidimicrobiales bacterium]|nr:LLM class flavin-dependent oxidoreductase [Acidimicrobiales bacterium]
MTIPVGVVIADAPQGGWSALSTVAADAESAGASSVWLTDHLLWHRPTVDVIGGLHQVAAATSRCRLGPCVLQLPLRDVASTAKSMAYLDEVSGGRVVVGVGVGEHEPEYAAAGSGDRFHRRGELLDAGVAQLRALWSGVRTGAVAMAPSRPLPIWVGGRSDAARRRAAAIGDAWAPHLVRASSLAAQRERLDRDLEAAGRDPSTLQLAPVLAAAIEELDDTGLEWFADLYGLPPSAFEHVVVRGSATRVADEVAALAAVGAREVTLFVPSRRAAEHVAEVTAALA